MKDLRVSDNRGLSHAASLAKESNRHLVVLHVLSPNDFKAHKRSARRIDFVLRNLRIIRGTLKELNVPLHVLSVTPRKSLPEKVADWCSSIKASDIASAFLRCVIVIWSRGLTMSCVDEGRKH